MDEKDKPKTSKITLDVDIQDVLDIVSKTGNQYSQYESPFSHVLEGEDLRKAWFKHMLISMEKLSDAIETVRHVDLVSLRSELKAEIKELKAEITKSEDELKVYKETVVDPLRTKVLTIIVKLSIWATIAGFIGSGIMGLFCYFAREYICAYVKNTLGTP